MARYKREPLWYKDAIIYELNIKAFCDSTGSGIGDFNGLMSKLDYLIDLGVTAIWLLPFYPSPLRDDGYDIADYYTISSRYGELKDFKRLLDAAHDRGLKVITELVINHSSDQHPWFQAARNAPAGSPERDYYVWSDDPKLYRDVRIIFQDFEESNWTWDPVAKSYYWHRFYSHQPDLNFDNPVVQEEIFKMLEYWADMGVDGFRLDAIPYLFERENTNCENLPETHVFLKKLRTRLDEKYENVLFLAEANMWPEDSASYFGDGDECHMNYHFPLMPRMYMSVKMEDRHPLTDIFEQTPEIPENCQWATFLRNHDELTLEMVTDEERDYMRKLYAPDPRARINLGIRRRLAPLMENDRRRIELMNILLLSLPGTPVLYYGDEIGMGDNYFLGDRDGVRTPMQWNENTNAGFSEANPQSLYLPVISDPEYDYKHVNVARQEANKNSLLWWTRKVLALRQKTQLFGRGNIKFLAPENSKILAFTREYEGETLLVLINLARHTEGVYLDLQDYKWHTPVDMFSDNILPVISTAPYFLTLPPYGYHWLSLKSEKALAAKPISPELKADTLAKLVKQAAFADEVLPNFLREATWFGNKDRIIESVEILDSIAIREDRILILKVDFRSGQPELIQLPLRFKTSVKDKWAIVGTAKINGVRGILVDAFQSKRFRATLLNGKYKKLTLAGEDLDKVKDSKVLAVTNQYVTAAFEEDYVVKFYRRIDTTSTPDFELTEWLSARKFAAAPKQLASIIYEKGKINAALASIQKYKKTRTNAWDCVLKNADNKSKLLEQMAMISENVAQLHLALLGKAADENPAFEAELFSLHYQRSLFSAFKGLVRSVSKKLANSLSELPAKDQAKARQVLDAKAAILSYLERIYVHKFEASKIRIHGNLHLGQINLTKKGVLFEDFDGTLDRSFTERKLRKSPLTDVATLLRSIHYVLTQKGTDASVYDAIQERVIATYKKHIEAAKLPEFIPESKKDFNILMDIFLMERALKELDFELTHRPDWAFLPMEGILSLLK